MSEVEKLRNLVRSAIQSRALFYRAIYEELRDEFGADKAATLMQRAIYKRGAAASCHLAGFAPNDFAGLKDAFLGLVPQEEGLFAAEVERCDGDGLDILFHRCPVKEAWQEAGLPDTEVAEMCRIAGILDNGMFEEAGFALQSETWKPGREGCCHLHIRPLSR